jgi:ABC-type lipoprotein release transport system permease subunit
MLSLAVGLAATYLMATVVVSGACLIAVWWPSLRAARVNPAITLRE